MTKETTIDSNGQGSMAFIAPPFTHCTASAPLPPSRVSFLFYSAKGLACALCPLPPTSLGGEGGTESSLVSARISFYEENLGRAQPNRLVNAPRFVLLSAAPSLSLDLQGRAFIRRSVAGR
jgi:hypothetical protein